MLINRTPLTNSIGLLLANMRLKGCSKLDIYSLSNWHIRCKESDVGAYVGGFYRDGYDYYRQLYNQVFGKVEYISPIQRLHELQKIATQIDNIKIFVRKDSDVEYDTIVYSFGCKGMQLLEATDNDSMQKLHSMAVAHIRHQCTSYDRMRKRLYNSHRHCYRSFITWCLKTKVLKEIIKVYPKYTSTCTAQIERLKELLIKDGSIDA